MKYSILIFLLAFLGTNVTMFAQKKETGEVIKAVKISQETAEAYWEKHIVKGFTVDHRGVLLPEKGYEIRLFLEKRQFVVKPIDMVYMEAGNFDIENVPGGTMFCMCSAGADDCEISVNVDGGSIFYFCDGSCGCGDFTVWNIQKEYPEYQTAEGDWRSF